MKIFVFILYTLFIVSVSILAYLNIIPTKKINIPYYDLVGHFILYGIWGYLFAIVFHKAIVKIGKFVLPWGIMVVTVITIVEECLQSLSPVRTSSFSDLLFSLLGISLSLIVFNAKRKSI
jgi:VanZ family protein